MLAAIPLRLGDEKKDDNTSAQTWSKLKSEKSSKKRKSSKLEKKNVTSSPDPSPKRTKDSTTEENVSFFPSKDPLKASLMW